MTRVAVFIDYQNVYMRARELFATSDAPWVEGQIHPSLVGLLLTDRGRSIDPSRRLERVKIFRGEPSAKHSAVGQAACQRQVEAWSKKSLVEPITRPLHYLQVGSRNGEPEYRPREKGIDVLIALSIVLGAVNDDYDVCVLFSADTDFLPALEQARNFGKIVEVAAWKPDTGYSSRLTMNRMWCHNLDRTDYERVVDRTDYTRGSV